MPHIKLIEPKGVGSKASPDVSGSVLSSQKSLAPAPDGSASPKPGNHIVRTINTQNLLVTSLYSLSNPSSQAAHIASRIPLSSVLVRPLITRP
jgi:hypothetical protein